ncbi:Crp/Fnr family transcriptional regulator [Nitrosomonas sp. JL21]|uniref:Crp/Fnr family transcriptional regulator n=1 Tax=Nitrosomonas sp. JL21 TaxID=153949 RepID=UPI00136A80AA|nr:Crp/Fnr family transcriptional regulator [Nitrosomonas sp. JL21]MBL8496656.1 Crp/Fnr family transcriptional regulator [Nitrosomonas sp.]MCC7091033.1 Crp/Fnr family transcriptional regulator [Nitrosomonas sp.]MXS76430.1 Crp/Fnr family transcriptional regulator [Nitrosomonas sp. JL21]
MTVRHLPLERACALLTTIKEFNGLSLPDREMIAQVCQWHRYEAGEEILRYHDHSTSVYFITQGEARVTFYSMCGKEVILCDLPAGEIFGELTAIDGQSRSATVVARTSSLVATISSADFHELIFRNRQISAAILKRLTGQIRRLTERVFEFSTLAVRNRVQAELLRLAKKNPAVANKGIISPIPTHTELANLVSTHREAVTRELNHLEKEQLILRKDHELHILDMAKLTDMVENARGDL